MNSNENKKTAPFAGLRMLISGILVFAGTLAYIPQSGIIRALPILAVMSAVGDVFYKSYLYNCGCAFVFSFCLLSVNGSSIGFCGVYSALAALFSLGSIYGVRLLRASYKTKKAELKKKCTVRSITVLVLTFAVYMLVCGNIIGIVSARMSNHEYIRKNYGDSIQILHTSFDAIDREYKTYVSFRHENSVVGDRDDCFVSKTRDNIRDYYEGVLLEEGKKLLSGRLKEAVDMFEVTNCGICFEDGEIIKPSQQYRDFEEKAWYVVSLYHIVDNEQAFNRLYEDCTQALEGFEFKEIIICGGNAQEVLYTATVTKDNGVVTPEPIKAFEEDYLEQYGVTEKTVLDYWLNR